MFQFLLCISKNVQNFNILFGIPNIIYVSQNIQKFIFFEK